MDGRVPSLNVNNVMAVKIRLQRGGKKNKPVYRIVVADARAKRDGKFIEKLGTFNPNKATDQVILNFDSAVSWYMKGAIPTDTMRTILSNEGVLYKKHLLVGAQKGAITQADVETKFNAWLEAKGKKAVDATAAQEKAAADALNQQEAQRAQIRKDAEDAQKAKEAEAILAAEQAEAAALAEKEAAEAPAEEPVAEAPAEDQEKAAE